MVQYGEKTKTVGLADYRCDTCKPRDMKPRGCHRYGNQYQMRPSAYWEIDYGTSQSKVAFCPLSFNLESLSNQVYQALRIKDAGGLEAYFKRPIASLPHITVYFYQMVMAAERRFIRHKEDLMARLKEQARSKAKAG